MICFIMSLKKLWFYTETVIRAIPWKASYLHVLLSVHSNHSIIYNYRYQTYDF